VNSKPGPQESEKYCGFLSELKQTRNRSDAQHFRIQLNGTGTQFRLLKDLSTLSGSTEMQQQT
jgi:hypothetical protein